MKYTVKIQEILERNIEVEASSTEEAWDIVDEMYRTEKIVLDSSDYVGYDMEVKA